MTLEALSSNEFLNFIIHDTISATPYNFSSDKGVNTQSDSPVKPGSGNWRRKQNVAAQGRKKRRRKTRVCKNKEEAETQRMTHIAVERNRRKQMNEHLAVLRSLMPESYVQRVCLHSLIISCSMLLNLASSLHSASVERNAEEV